MNRLMEYTVFCGFVTAWRLATWPTSRSPDLVMATTEGVVLPPSWFGITTGSPPCITATTELVVPKSIPIILLITGSPPPDLRLLVQCSSPLDAAILQIECGIVKYFDYAASILFSCS